MLSRVWFNLLSSFLLFTPLFCTWCNSSLWGDSLISLSISSSSLNSLIPLSFWLGGIMMMMSHNSVMTSIPTKKPFLFMLCILTLTLVVSVFFTLSGLISFYFLFELSLIPTFILIMVWGYQPERLQASMYMLMYTVAASLPLLLTLGYLFSTNHSLLFYFVSSKFESVMMTNLKPILYISLMTAFMVKLPVYGVHIWLPKAHVEAPVSGSMALAGVLLKLGGAGIFRMNGITGVMKPFPMMLSITLLGGLISSIACLLQTDFKALIAYSSVGHMSMVFAGLLGSGIWGLKGSIINMVAHGFVSPGMFALANVFYKACSTRSMQVCKGLLSLSPAITTWTAVFCFANMSNPPTINLLSEMLIFPALASYSFFLLLIGGGLCFLAMAFSMHLYMNTQHGSGNPVLNPAGISFSHTGFLALSAPVYFLVIGIFI